MHNSAIINILKTLSHEDLNDFLNYVQSPIFNKKVILVEFVILLKKTAPDYNSRIIEKEQVFKKLFPNKKYEDKLLGWHISYLKKLLLQFLGFKNLFSHKELTKLFVLDELKTRNIKNEFEKLHTKLNTELKDISFAGLVQLRGFESFLFERISNQYGLQNKTIKGIPYETSHVNKMYTSLETMYFINKFRLICHTITRNYQLTKNVEIPLVNETINFYESKLSDFQNDKTALFYYYMTQTLLTEKKEWFLKAVSLFIKPGSLPYSIKSPAIFHFHNFITNQSHKGNISPFVNEIIKVYDDVLIKNEHLSKNMLKSYPGLFINFTYLSHKAGQLEAIKDFVLLKVNRGRSNLELKICLAMIYIFEKDSRKALDVLQSTTHNTIWNYIIIKTMMFRVYFNLKMIDDYYTLLNTFSLYLKRNAKVSPKYVTKKYEQYIAYSRTLIKLQNEYLSYNNKKVRKEIEEFKKEMIQSGFPYEEWWMEAIDDMLINQNK